MTVIDPNKKWTHPLPIWVSRKDADDFIATFTVPMWLFLFIGFVVLLNVVGWSVVGLVELVQYIIP